MKLLAKVVSVVVLLMLVGCSRAVYTPAVFPASQNDPKKEIRGPATKSFDEAQAWAIAEVRKLGPSTEYIVYKNLYWDKKHGMEMAEEKLK